jgi:hypothetical protein
VGPSRETTIQRAARFACARSEESELKEKRAGSIG